MASTQIERSSKLPLIMPTCILDFSEAEFANFLKTFDLDSHQKLAALSKGNRKN